MKNFIFIFTSILIISGCGGGSSSTTADAGNTPVIVNPGTDDINDSQSTDESNNSQNMDNSNDFETTDDNGSSNNNENPNSEDNENSSNLADNSGTDLSDSVVAYHGYYVDDPIVNVHYHCGIFQGQTGNDGYFRFEADKECTFFVGSIQIQTIPAEVLQDGIVVFESSMAVATLLQSLDSNEDDQVLNIETEVVEAINTLDIHTIPTDISTFVDKLNTVLQGHIELKAKTDKEALSHLRESYLDYVHRSKLYLTDKHTDLSENAHGYTKDEVDEKAETLFGEDNTTLSITDNTAQKLIGNWVGNDHNIRIILQLRKDGTYKYESRLGIGKYHNYYRYSHYEGKWSLDKGNSQVVLELPNVDAPLVLTNDFPTLVSPADVTLWGGNAIDNSNIMQIDQSQNEVSASYTQNAQTYMAGKTSDFAVDYFTMVAPKANSEAFWSSANVQPMGYNYGHKLGNWTDEWNYALKRIKDDPKNYTMVISDENWQTMIGARWNYTKDILKPEKMYKWFEYFKDQMQILGKVPGTVLYVIAGDAPANWVSSIRTKYNNDASTIPAKLIESRFPEVLERNPSNSFAGVFQMMDYLRMKYAPNVKLGYTIKTWGIVTKDIYHEPEGGWDVHQDTQTMADTINSFGIQFDFLSFNFHPRSSHTVEEYESAAKYFGAISKKLKTRDGTQPKLWIWKLSLWNKEQPKFDFTHIDFLVNECNTIGMTLGHGNDLKNQSGFKDDKDAGIYVKSWIDEYYHSITLDGIPVHATQGPIMWR